MVSHQLFCILSGAKKAVWLAEESINVDDTALDSGWLDRSEESVNVEENDSDSGWLDRSEESLNVDETASDEHENMGSDGGSINKADGDLSDMDEEMMDEVQNIEDHNSKCKLDYRLLTF